MFSLNPELTVLINPVMHALIRTCDLPNGNGALYPLSYHRSTQDKLQELSRYVQKYLYSRYLRTTYYNTYSDSQGMITTTEMPIR